MKRNAGDLQKLKKAREYILPESFWRELKPANTLIFRTADLQNCKIIYVFIIYICQNVLQQQEEANTTQ